jgi:hypothetical protein
LKRWLRDIRSAWPTFKDDQTELYWDELNQMAKRFGSACVTRGLQNAIEQSKWLPAIAELRTYVRAASKPEFSTDVDRVVRGTTDGGRRIDPRVGAVILHIAELPQIGPTSTPRLQQGTTIKPTNEEEFDGIREELRSALHYWKRKHLSPEERARANEITLLGGNHWEGVIELGAPDVFYVAWAHRHGIHEALHSFDMSLNARILWRTTTVSRGGSGLIT